MLKKYETASVQGSKGLNEDAFVVNETCGVFGVFDGATSVVGWLDHEGKTGGYLASHLFQDHFSNLKLPVDVRQEIITTNDSLRERMVAAGIDMQKKHELWCTCVAVVQIMNGEIRYWQLGDSMIVALYRDGSYRVLTQDTVFGISERAKQKREREVENGARIDLSLYTDPIHVLQYNRSMANTPDGYSVANGMKEVADYIDSGAVQLEGLDGIILMTDGLFYPARDGRSTDWDETVRQIRDCGIDTYISSLLEIEHRIGRRIDDKTAVILNL